MISDLRTGLRCGRCKGLVGWWDNPPHTKKIMPFKRAWSEAECLAIKYPFSSNRKNIKFLRAPIFLNADKHNSR